MKKSLFACFLAASSLYPAGACPPLQTGISSVAPTTTRDYSALAQSITAGAVTSYEKAEAIYRWMIRNIAYDTTYSIYTADECYDYRRGVCQAYCELYQAIAACVGLDCRIISGISRNTVDHEVSTDGHAWLFVVTEPERFSGILVDPTWGAGSVKGRMFYRSDNDMSWFNVDPHWLIFTHLPDESMWQLLPTPVTKEQFYRLPGLAPMLAGYGLDGASILQKALQKRMDVPEFHCEVSKIRVKFKQIPMERVLRIGTTYRFVIENIDAEDLAIISSDKRFLLAKDWTRQGNTYTVDYVPDMPGKLLLSAKKGSSQYSSMLKYEVAQPTMADYANLEKTKPYSMPELRQLTNYNPDKWKEVGVNGSALLQAVRMGKVTAMPKFCYAGNFSYRLWAAPITDVLHVGEAYTFRLQKKTPGKLAVINGTQWFTEWVDDANGISNITVIPSQRGVLRISVQLPGDTGYTAAIEYRVE
ncbi:transglutaminase domain-containing protein [uncultured Bacteroides sp.]|uniref:transglutaminase domain-containing protein n=1 Tax=uncultured Bacteroides sp. TaxID=162156 RepID=UPI00260C6406|nr:transglutaminase domain-containing protein [uncultured Bacteroides sp.]